MAEKSYKVVALGFGSCEKLKTHVVGKLSEYYDKDFIGFSYREARADPEYFHNTVEDAEVFTDSAGFTNLDLNTMKPKSVLAVSAPIPVFLPLLIGKACKSGLELMKPVEGESPEYAKLKRTCGENLVREVRRHPRANMNQLGRIATFDAFKEATAAKKKGMDIEMLYRKQDRLFQPTDRQLETAEEAGLVVVTIDGPHEGFACGPAKTMEEYEAARKLLVA